MFYVKVNTKEIFKTIRKKIFTQSNGRFFCPRCGKKATHYKTNKNGMFLYYCPHCRKENRHSVFSDLSFTIFKNCKIPFEKICLVSGFFMQNMNASEIFRTLKNLEIKISLKSVWRITNKFRRLMKRYVHSEEYSKSFSNQVFEIDEVYLPCRQMYDEKKSTVYKRGIKRGVASQMQVCVQFIISKSKTSNKKMKSKEETEEKEKNREIYFTILKGLKSTDMKESFDKFKYKAHTIHHDDFKYTFPNKNEVFFNHYQVKHSKNEYVRTDIRGGLIHTNTAESINNIVKSALRRYRSVALKNLPLYLSEMIFKLYQKKTIKDLWELC